MTNFIKDKIMQKLSNLTPSDILSHSQQYGFNITNQQARAITQYIKTNHINPFKAANRTKMVQDLAKITDLETAQKANKLFNQLVNQYGLKYLFKE